jgi:hypothetical protein
MSYIAQQARINQDDPPQTIVTKLMIWVSGNMPNVSEEEIREQASRAWTAIHAAWEQPAGDFDAAWAATTSNNILYPAGAITASNMGRKGGGARTAAKIASSRENGKKGGRPRKQPVPA